MCKENKNNDFIQQYFSSKSRIPSLWRVSRRMRVCSSACKQGSVHVCYVSSITHMRCLRAEVLSITAEYVIWRRSISWIKSLYLFFVHKKYSHSFVKLPLMSHGLFYWCLYYISRSGNPVALLSMQGQKALGFHQKHQLKTEISFLGKLSL